MKTPFFVFFDLGSLRLYAHICVFFWGVRQKVDFNQAGIDRMAVFRGDYAHICVPYGGNTHLVCGVFLSR